MLISYIRVHRPLTPPYVRFRIRRFLVRVATWHTRQKDRYIPLSQAHIWRCCVHYRCPCYSPIALNISPSTCVILVYSAFNEVLDSGLGKLPWLPYTNGERTDQCDDGSNGLLTSSLFNWDQILSLIIKHLQGYLGYIGWRIPSAGKGFMPFLKKWQNRWKISRIRELKNYYSCKILFQFLLVVSRTRINPATADVCNTLAINGLSKW